MDTKRAKALANLWSTKSKQSCCIDEKVWYFAGDDNPLKIKYSFTYFTAPSECQSAEFPNFKAVEKFIKDYIKEA